MAMSIYYTAKRTYQMNDEEKANVRSVADKYCKEFPFDFRHEDFCLYDEPFDEENTILAGATAIPQKKYYDVILYWLKCLTDITRILHECEWDVRFEDVDLIWEEDDGWRLPTDEEMKQRRTKYSCALNCIILFLQILSCTTFAAAVITTAIIDVRINVSIKSWIF